MSEFRSLNEKGIDVFRAFLRNVHRNSPAAFPSELITGSEFGRTLIEVEDTTLEQVSLNSKCLLARDLHRIFSENSFDKPTQDPGFWAWLGVRLFDQVCERDEKGDWKPGPDYRWIPDSDYKRFYRHVLAGPWRAYSLHARRPELTEPLLSSRLSARTEIYEQLVSSIEVIQADGVLEAVRKLYWDADREELKMGHGGKGAGSIRRFSTFLNQIALTWDLNSVSGEELLGLLPAEFDKWKS